MYILCRHSTVLIDEAIVQHHGSLTNSGRDAMLIESAGMEFLTVYQVYNYSEAAFKLPYFLYGSFCFSPFETWRYKDESFALLLQNDQADLEGCRLKTLEPLRSQLGNIKSGVSQVGKALSPLVLSKKTLSSP